MIVTLCVALGSKMLFKPSDSLFLDLWKTENNNNNNVLKFVLFFLAQVACLWE